MKAKTKFQKKIVALSEKLPGLTEDQVTYLSEKLFTHGGTQLKSGKMSCLDCGHQWQNTDNSKMGNLILGSECPNCHTELKIKQTRHKVFAEGVYYQVIQTYKGHQVIRLFEANKYFKAGHPAVLNYSKVYENWISEDGKTETIGRYQMNKWSDQWCGSYELRSTKNSTCYNDRLNDKNVYPKKTFIKKLRRNGLKTSLHDCNPFLLMLGLLNDKNPKAETLLKAKQYHLLNQYVVDKRGFEEHWPSIKICLRNDYYVAEPSDWLDYLKHLAFFGKDLHNPKYICPKVLKREHNKYVERKRKLDLKISIRDKAKKLKEQQALYVKTKSKYFGIEFNEENLQVSFMNSVKQFFEEGNLLRHCIYSGGYYKKESLMFSVRQDGKVVGTAEVGPKSGSVLQLRTVHNNLLDKDIDNKIRQMITKNMASIMNPKPKARKKKQTLAMAS